MNIGALEEFFGKFEHYDIRPAINRIFTMACIFHKEYAENFLSDWLAFVLDPERNGIGLEPLRILLDLAEYKKVITDNAKVDIKREYIFPQNCRRIDFIIIVDDEELIAIENKINHREGPNQLKDYSLNLDEFKKPGKINPITDNSMNIDGITKILLKPESNEIKPTNDFVKVSYEDLIKKFKMLQLNFIDDLRAAFFVKEFIIHMEEYIMTIDKSFKIDPTLLKIIENKKMLDEINKKYNKENTNFRDHIRSQFALEFNSEEDWIVNNSHSRYIQIYKESWEECKIHFEMFINSKDWLSNDEKCILVLHYESKSENSKVHIDELKGINFEFSSEVIIKDKSSNKSKTETETEICKYTINNAFYDEIGINRNLKEIVKFFTGMRDTYTSKIDSICSTN